MTPGQRRKADLRGRGAQKKTCRDQHPNQRTQTLTGEGKLTAERVADLIYSPTNTRLETKTKNEEDYRQIL